MSPAPILASHPDLDALYRPVPLTTPQRHTAVAAILAVGVRRLIESRRRASFSAGRSSPILPEDRTSGLANSAETSVTVSKG